MMTTAATDQLTETIQNLKEVADSALANESPDELSDFEKYVNEVEAFVRETQQAMWANEAKTTISNLEKGQPLSPHDKDVIRAFLVSDAESYLEHENNYADWKREMQRLTDELVRRANVVDRNTIGDLRGVLKDAIRLVPDIRNYLEERQRINKFDEALDSPDPSSRAIIVRLMREQLRSDKR
jgi:hypothetical protein